MLTPVPPAARYTIQVKQPGVHEGVEGVSYAQEAWRECDRGDLFEHLGCGVAEGGDGGGVNERRAIAACLTLALDAMHDAGTACDSEETPFVGDTRQTDSLSPYVVEWPQYFEVARRANMRGRAAAVEHSLAKAHRRYKATAPAFKSLDRLQEEQGHQMAILVETGCLRQELSQLVESHAIQLSIAANAAQACLTQHQHQQRYTYRQALESLLTRNPDTFPVLPSPVEGGGGNGGGGGGGGGGGTERGAASTARDDDDLFADTAPTASAPSGGGGGLLSGVASGGRARWTSMLDFGGGGGGGGGSASAGHSPSSGTSSGGVAAAGGAAPAAGFSFNPVGTIARAVGVGGGSGGGGGSGSAASASAALGGDLFAEEASSGAYDPLCPTGFGVGAPQQREGGGGGGGGGSGGEDSTAPSGGANIDITTDNNVTSLQLTVPMSVGDGVGELRGLRVDFAVRLINIKTAVATCLTYERPEDASPARAPPRTAQEEERVDRIITQRRAETMRRIARDDVGAWIVPVSVHDVATGADGAASVATSLTARSFDPHQEAARNVAAVLPQHLVDSAGASPELVFPSFIDAVAEALACLEHAPGGGSGVTAPYKIEAGTVIATKHTNMPCCNLLLITLYDPLDAAATRAAVEKATTLAQAAAFMFLDVSKVAQPEMVTAVVQAVVRKKALLSRVKPHASRRNHPLHTSSALKDRDGGAVAAAAAAAATAAEAGGGAAAAAAATTAQERRGSPPLSVVLSASQLATSADTAKGPFAAFAPVVSASTLTPASSPGAGSR